MSSKTNTNTNIKNSINTLKRKSITSKSSKSTKKLSRNVSLKVSNIRKSRNSQDPNDFTDELANILLNNDFNNQDRVDKLRKLYVNMSNRETYYNYNSQFNPFNKLKQGRSGAMVGTLKYIPNTLMKVNVLKENTNINNIVKYNGCINVNSKFLELIINSILTSPEKFAKFTSEELELLEKYTLRAKHIGLYKNNAYLIFPLIGLVYKDYNFTNLQEVIINNHMPILVDAIKNNNEKLIKTYDEYITNQLFVPLFRCLIILQNKLHFINSDLKLANVFIKKQDNKIKKYDVLRDKGFIVDIIPIIADLDKGSVIVNNNKILPSMTVSLIVDKLRSMAGYGILYNVRHNCEDTFTRERCGKMNIYDFDMITAVFDLYARLYKQELINNVEIRRNLPTFNLFVMNMLDLNDKDFQLIWKTIKDSSIGKSTNIRLGTILSKIIGKYCNKL